MRLVVLLICVLSILGLGASAGFAQETRKNAESDLESLKNYNQNLRHRLDVLQRQVDDLMWYTRIGEYAFIDKVYMYGPPLAKQQEKNPTGQGAGNPVKFLSYIFI
ncbi:MAG: S9 family peptidase, partial [Candidatus Krumholzibacteria bacterium]|nr:S9 family peptidase [Candidatus Krumholzibacteria bacterium]